MTEPSFNRPLGPVTISELTAGLAWPRLFRAFALSLRPRRVIMGTATVLLLWVAAKLVRLVMASHGGDAPGNVLAEIADGLGGAAGHLVRLQFADAAGSAELAWTAIPVHMDSWAAMTVFAILAAPVWVVCTCALARSAAVDVAGDFDLSILRSVVFGLRRLSTLLSAFLIPLGFAALVSLGLRAVGFVLLWLQGVSVVGALLYPVAWIGGLVLVLVLVGYALGQWLLAPAVAADGADATDAVQRAYAYILARPARTLIYAAILLLVGALAFVLVNWLLRTADGWARELIVSWLPGERAHAVLATASGSGEPTSSLTSNIMEWWSWMLGAIVAGWGVSYYSCAATLGYLVLRRVNDHQDEHEIWMPGMIGGTMAARKKPA